jgi:ATP-dependent Lhr-like helicase
MMISEAVDGLSKDVGGVFFGNFAELRPVQTGAIRSICAGRNVVISAATGSGKTEAVLAPLVSRFRMEAIQNDEAVILYICPTKALINDLSRRLKLPLERLGLNLAVRHGDRNELDQSRTTHVILTTPESFGILIAKKHPALESIRAIVLDEVHLLYNNQRGQMVAILLHRLRRISKHAVQVAALSATVGRLDDIRSFMGGKADETDLLAFPGSRQIDGDIRVPPSASSAVDLLERLMKVSERKLLVFVNSRSEAERIAGALKSRPGLDDLVLTHHSSLSPEGRERVERRFESESRAICVSTSTLEMGIDIGDIDAVVLYGPPMTVESMLQRIGRGNRRSNTTNVICLSRDRAGSIRELSVFSSLLALAAHGRMPSQGPFLLFGAVAQQSLAKVVQEAGSYTRIAEICEEVSYRPDLDRPKVECILDALEEHEWLLRHGFKNRFGATGKLWDLRDKHLIWGNFPLGGQTIDLVNEGRFIGTVPRANLMRLGKGAVFRFGGSRYAVTGLLDREVRVKPAVGNGGEVPLIFGKGGGDGLDAFMANSLWGWVFSVEENSAFMQPRTWAIIREFIGNVRSLLGPSDLPFSEQEKGVRYFTFAGITVNRVILSWLGLNPAGADDLSLAAPQPLDWSKLPTSADALLSAAEKCFATSDRQTIFQQALPLELQKSEWVETWLKDGDASAALHRLAASSPVQVPGELFAGLLG